jgi:glycosyltransferase involved in cell wall biosynthesis
MKCAIIIPFLNEASYLPTFLASMDRQTRRPDLLVLVDDGSTDASADAACQFAEHRSWVSYLRRPPQTKGKDRLNDAPEFRAFLWAYAMLDGDFDVVAKMDGDLDLAPTHVEQILDVLAKRDDVGMAGCWLYAEGEDGQLYREPHPAHHVRGPTRFYRRTCLDAIQPLPIGHSWDCADEVRARDRGWKTVSIALDGKPTVHLRPTGNHDGRLRAFARWGRGAHFAGAHPLGVLAGGAVRMRQRPRVIGGVAFVVGWAAAGLERTERAPADVRRAYRREQVRRLTRMRSDLEEQR